MKGPLTDLGLHHPPSKGHRARQAYCACGQIAQRLRPRSARRQGLRPPIRHFVPEGRNRDRR